jgi:DNA-directed RNA polymerase specialized sigma24 family protein
MRTTSSSSQRTDEVDWDAVIGRALCQIALAQREDLREADLPTKATFLQGMGLAKADIALLVGSTEGSVKEALQRAKKGVKKNGRKK